MILVGRENSITIQDEADQTCEWNKTFLKKIIKKEKDINKFMKRFYDRTLILPYTSAHKVCKIKELDIIKNEEEEEEQVGKEGLLHKKEQC